METKQLAPAPRSGLQLAIYNVLHDHGKSMDKLNLWQTLPKQFHRPHGANKFGKALSNMVQRGIIQNHSTGKVGIYQIAPLDVYKQKIAHTRKIARKCQRKIAAKKKAANGHGTPWKDPIIQRIDKRIGALEHKLGDLKALRELVREADL